MGIQETKCCCAFYSESRLYFIDISSCQVLWIRWILNELKHEQVEATTLFCDNRSAISYKDLVFHGKSKHIRIKYHLIRNLVKDGKINVMHCKTQEQIVDIFTKALKYDVFNEMKEKLSMVVI